MSALELLREQWKIAMRAHNDAGVAAAHAQREAAAFNAMVAAESLRRLVPPGFAIDILGDGLVKPENQIARVLADQ